MRTKLAGLFAVIAATAFLAACGGGGGGGGEESDFSKAETISITGVSTDDDFATNGEFTVGFIAQDADGNAILAKELFITAQVVKTTTYGKWNSSTIKATDDNVTCGVTTPASTDCTLDDISSVEPSEAGKAVGVALIDDSGSMSSSDPTDLRKDASEGFLDAVCATVTNMFGVFDFGAGMNMSFLNTRDLMTADGVTDAELEGDNSELPYADCATENVTLAKTAIDNQVMAIGGTPMYESILELCEDMKAKAEDQLSGYALAMLVLGDGSPNSEDQKAAAEACLTDNGITACTVGLGSGSELDPTAIPAAVDALKSIATAGNCVYAAATDADALEAIFDAIGVAVTEGQNFADFAVSPVPATGTTVTGTLTVGEATATFTFVAP